MTTLELPPLHHQMILVDIYFSYCHGQPYSLFHENNFRERFNSGALAPALLLAVIANSCRFANHLPNHDEEFQDAGELAERAWSAISTNCLAGSGAVDLSVLQTLILLCIFDFTCESVPPASSPASQCSPLCQTWSGFAF